MGNQNFALVYSFIFSIFIIFFSEAWQLSKTPECVFSTKITFFVVIQRCLHSTVSVILAWSEVLKVFQWWISKTTSVKSSWSTDGVKNFFLINLHTEFRGKMPNTFTNALFNNSARSYLAIFCEQSTLSRNSILCILREYLTFMFRVSRDTEYKLKLKSVEY